MRHCFIGRAVRVKQQVRRGVMVKEQNSLKEKPLIALGESHSNKSECSCRVLDSRRY